MLSKVNPNYLTSMRLILAIPVAILLLNQGPILLPICLAIMILVEVTDFLDGYVARKYNKVTDFGKIYDPACDAIYHCVVFICLIELGLPIWMALIFVVREMSMMAIRMYCLMKNYALAARASGKLKANFQMAMQFAWVICICVLSYDYWWLFLVMMFANVILAVILWKKKSGLVIELPIAIFTVLAACVIFQSFAVLMLTVLMVVTAVGALALTIYSLGEYLYFLRQKFDADSA